MYQHFIPFYCWILLRCSIPHHILSVHSSVSGHSGVFTFWLLWVTLLWTFVYEFLCGHRFSVLLGIYIYIYIYISVSVSISMSISIYLHLYLYICICIYIYISVSISIYLYIYIYVYLEVKWLCPMGPLYSTLLRNYQTIFHSNSTFYIPISHIWWLKFFHLLSNNCYFFIIAIWLFWNDILWFWSSFP